MMHVLPLCRLVALTVVTWLATVRATPIDNRLIGQPMIECLDKGVRMSIITDKPFRGRIFVKVGT
jgi:hypothetical protein